LSYRYVSIFILGDDKLAFCYIRSRIERGDCVIEDLDEKTNEEIRDVSEEVLSLIVRKMSARAKKNYSETNFSINALCTSLVFIAVKSLTKDEDELFMKMLNVQIYESIKLNRE
jgi:hypothetical protein